MLSQNFLSAYANKNYVTIDNTSKKDKKKSLDKKLKIIFILFSSTVLGVCWVVIHHKSFDEIISEYHSFYKYVDALYKIDV